MNLPIISKRRSISQLWQAAAVLVLAVSALGGVSLLQKSSTHAAATNGSLYLSPAQGTYMVGDLVTVTIEENSGTTAVNGVQANLSYPSSELQYESYSVAGSGFNFPGPAPSVSPGSFSYAILSTNQLTGTQQVATVTFKVLSSGSAAINFASGSAVAEPDGANEDAALAGANFTLQTPVQPVPVVAPPQSVPTPIRPVPATPAPVSHSSAAPVFTVIPSGSSTPVSTPSGSKIRVSVPATFQPVVTPVHPTSPAATVNNPIVRVQYYLNNKLVATKVSSPFSYTLDTPNLLNGNYTLKTKTFYASGAVRSSKQHVLIANPPSFKQFRLVMQHYANPALLVVVIAVVIWAIFILRHQLYRFVLGRRLAVTGVPVAAPSQVVTPGTMLNAKPQAPPVIGSEAPNVSSRVQSTPPSAGTVVGPQPDASKDEQSPPPPAAS